MRRLIVIQEILSRVVPLKSCRLVLIEEEEANIAAAEAEGEDLDQARRREAEHCDRYSLPLQTA